MTETIKHGTTRTDALRPSVFDPADFAVETYVDLEEFRDGGFSGHIREWEQDIIAIFGDRGRAFVENNDFDGNPLWVCDHCGAQNLRYIAAVRQISTGAIFVFGSSCVARAELNDRQELKLVQLRKEAANRRLRALNREKAANYLNANEDIRAFILSIPRGEHGEAKHSFGFINSMDEALNKYGELTPRQAEVLRKVIAEQPERERIEAERAERDANKGPAPEGRQTVRGEIVSVKAKDGYMPGEVSYKMVVRLENGSAVWVTVPRAIEDQFYIADRAHNDAETAAIVAWQDEVKELFLAHHTAEEAIGNAAWTGMIFSEMLKTLGDEAPEGPGRSPAPTLADFLKGRKVELTATFEVSDRDEHFAFGKRPIVKFVEEN